MLTHEQILKYFDKDYTHGQEVREKAANDMVFAWVTQWDDDTLAGSDLEYRGEFNIIRKAVRHILTDLVINEVQVDFEPDEGTDDKASDILDGIYRANMRYNVSQEAKKNASQEAVACGVGAWELVAEYKNPWSEKQHLVRRPIYEANNCVFWDNNAKLLDKSDATRVTILESFSEDAYEALKDDLGIEDDGSNFAMPYTDLSFQWVTGSKQIYVGKFYHREIKTCKYYVYEDAFGTRREVESDDLDEQEDSLVDGGFDFVEEKKKKEWRITRYLVSGEKILETAEIAGEHIPVVPQYGERAFVDGVEWYEGVVRLAKDPQRLRNFQLSYLATIVARSPREKPIFGDEQIAGYEDMYEMSGAENNLPYVKMRTLDSQGNPLPMGPLGYIKAPEVPPALMASISESRAAVDDVASVGLMPDIADTDLSGKAINSIQKRLDMQSYTYQDNHKYAMRRDGEIFASMFSAIMDEEQEITLVNYDGSRKKETINKQKFDYVKDTAYTENDTTKMRFNVHATIGPAFESVREQQMEQLKELIMSQPPGSPTHTMLLNKFLTLTPGAGFEDIRDFANLQLVLSGVRKPETEEEMAALKQAQEAPKEPDANMVLAQAEQIKGQADIMAQENKKLELQLKMADLQEKYSGENKKRDSETAVNIAKVQQGERKLSLDEQKVMNDFALRLAELEQTYGRQLDGEVKSNMLVFDPLIGDFA